MYVQHAGTGKKVAIVAVGAMLVGSVNWTRKAGEEIKKGEELGYFAYGGSTVIAVFPTGLIKCVVHCIIFTFFSDCLRNGTDSTRTWSRTQRTRWRHS